MKLYSEQYQIRKVKEPAREGQNYLVSHYVPIDKGTALALKGSRYFETEAEAVAYKEKREEAIRA
jgi:hypothetical protein